MCFVSRSRSELTAQLFPDCLFVERHCRAYLALWMCNSSGLTNIPFQRCVPPFYTDGWSHSSRLLVSLRSVLFAPYFAGLPTTGRVVRTWCAKHSEHEPVVGEVDCFFVFTIAPPTNQNNVTNNGPAMKVSMRHRITISILLPQSVMHYESARRTNTHPALQLEGTIYMLAAVSSGVETVLTMRDGFTQRTRVGQCS